ncbi:MAG: hypothetical protein AAF565_05755, partial [Pseudomonadota bacterium]
MEDEGFLERYEEILAAVRRRLWEEWDPIGVRRLGGPSDEYENYAPAIASILARGRSAEAVVDNL